MTQPRSKNELRSLIRSLKVKHSAEMASLSTEICRIIEGCAQFSKAHTVLLYHPLPDEVDVSPVLAHWNDSKTILLPVVQGDDLILRAYDPTHMQQGAFGISEPEGTEFTYYDAIGFAAVPGMAFDLSGHRLGRGKGYYDRLLPRLHNAYKAGICFPFQLVEHIPTEEHDILMNQIITLHQR